jgi:hypothetical protein
MNKRRKVKGLLFFFMIVTLVSSCSQQNNESKKTDMLTLFFKMVQSIQLIKITLGRKQ